MVRREGKDLVLGIAKVNLDKKIAVLEKDGLEHLLNMIGLAMGQRRNLKPGEWRKMLEKSDAIILEIFGAADKVEIQLGLSRRHLIQRLGRYL